MNITYPSHTANIKVYLEANTLEGLFKKAVYSMGNILKDNFCQETHQVDIKILIVIKAGDNTQLLIDFLSNVLSQSYMENTVFWKTEILLLEEFMIRAKLSGTSVKAFDTNIKRVSLQKTHVIRKTEDTWASNILFNI